jgi:hypothetical protein
MENRMIRYDAVQFQERNYNDLVNEFIEKNENLFNKFVEDRYQSYLENGDEVEIQDAYEIYMENKQMEK